MSAYTQVRYYLWYRPKNWATVRLWRIRCIATGGHRWVPMAATNERWWICDKCAEDRPGYTLDDAIARDRAEHPEPTA